MTQKLASKIALITGDSSGLDLATATCPHNPWRSR
jgi:NAD(P)-dependent dehydrogenase (short-subunit alcohol dehydrogenase family)